MRTPILIGTVCLAALAGCGLEGMFGNLKHKPFDRPASRLQGAASWQGLSSSQIAILDGTGAALQGDAGPFATLVDAAAGTYDVKLPSSTYQFLRVRGRAGNFALRALVPSIGPETTLGPVDLDARNMTEALIVEARLSGDGKKLTQLTPGAYVGDGETTGTRTLIRQAFDAVAPDVTPAQQATQELLAMVTTILGRQRPFAGSIEPDFFREPTLAKNPDATYRVTSSPLNSDYFLRNPLDYDPATPGAETSSAPFDAKLAQVAALYDPSGCEDPDHIRIVFSVDFNAGGQDGACNTVNRFLWAKDAPGKSMFFVGWIHAQSPFYDPAVNALLGAGVPNSIPMNDDGVNGDEAAGDGIWSVTFDVPSHAPGDLTKHLRVGYKYTWGTFGAPWTGSEEWPGNSRILEVVDVNGDGFVHRHDVFGDECSNKDRSNLYPGSGGSIDWTTDLRGCGPEAQEQQSDVDQSGNLLHSMCKCTEWLTPQSIGPLKLACEVPAGP